MLVMSLEKRQGSHVHIYVPLEAKLSPKCNLGFFCQYTRVKPLCKGSTLTVLHVTLHSEIDTSPLAGRQRAEQASANMSCSKTFFLVNSVYTNNVLNARVHV